MSDVHLQHQLQQFALESIIFLLQLPQHRAVLLRALVYQRKYSKDIVALPVEQVITELLRDEINLLESYNKQQLKLQTDFVCVAVQYHLSQFKRQVCDPLCSNQPRDAGGLRGSEILVVVVHVGDFLQDLVLRIDVGAAIEQLEQALER